MIEIFNKELPNKKLIKSLTYVYGINSKIASTICKEIGFNPNVKLDKFSTSQLNFLKKYIENEEKYQNQFGYNLAKKRTEDIENLITMKTYRGSRHLNKLPVRGQRTHSNARTQKKNASYRGGMKMSS